MTEQLKKYRYLFLDRDGVINRRKVGGYIQRVEEFCFLPGVLGVFPFLATRFERIVIVTNQQGIGKGLMTEADLEAIHDYMRREIEARGGRIDAIYHCPCLAEANCDCRKPNTGMALQAQADFPEIDFAQSLLVGDSVTDLQMGLQLAMHNVWLGQLPLPTQAQGHIQRLADLPNYLMAEAGLLV